MAGVVLISVFLLMLTVSWSLYDEFYGLRPWRSYQAEFSKVYSSYLEKQYQKRKADEQKFYATPEYEKLLADVKAAHDAARAKDQEIGQQIELLDRQRAAMTDMFQLARGLVGSLTYQLEKIDEKNKSAKESKLKELNEAKAQTYEVNWPVEGDKVVPTKYNYQHLNDLFTSIMSSKARLVAERGKVDQPEKDAQDKLAEYVKEQLPGLTSRDLDSVEKAHGRYEHWLWPLNYRENFEAGCQQCHASDMVTEHAPVLNHAKALYREKGCIGCHRFQGFDNQDEQLVSARQMIAQLENQKQDDRLQIAELNKKGDAATDNDAANAYYAQATNLTVTISSMDAQIEELEQRSHNLLEEIKKVGPDLKEVRMKIHKEWIPYWLKHTHEFRPTTKMPQFRLQDDEIQAIAAYVWQSAITGPELPKQTPGNAAHGKELFEQRGCEACHSIGEGPNMVGGDFAANLSRVGEKDNYDYLVRWILNPRVRTRPYSPSEKKDLGPEDYAKHNLPFVFDLDHSRSPNDGHELVVQQMTVMPSLRLTVEDARDIASFLLTQKHADASYPAADFMDNPNPQMLQ